MSFTRRSALITVMIKAVEKVGRQLMRDFGEVENLQVSKKGPMDFVSAADIKAEETLHYELSKARPKFGFLMEETGEHAGEDKDRRFIIDPLDGTKNFLRGIPFWAISVAAEENGQITAGVVYNPILDELFWAERGQGAYLNNRRLEVTRHSKLADCVISAGNSRISGTAEFEAVGPYIGGLRRMGSCAMSMCYVAAGKLDGYWGYGVNPWDVAAAKVIVSEARGRFTDLENGKENDIYAGNYVVTNGQIHNELRQLVLKGYKTKAKAAS